jgi:L-amino acid N-acyltransferase YncA
MKKTIRRIEARDAEAVSAIYAPFVTDNSTSFETEAPDAEAVKQRIRDMEPQYPWLVFEGDGVVLGYAYGSSHRSRKAYQWSVEVSVYIHELARKCGLGRALYLSLFEVLRRQGYANAYAGITLPNPASVGLHEALGFTSIGVFSKVGFKFGQWHDVAWLELRLQDPAEPVPTPHPAIDFFADDQVVALFQRQAQEVTL